MNESVHKLKDDVNSDYIDETHKNIEIGDFDNGQVQKDIESADTDKPKAIRVAYEDRWDWWKWIKRQPNSILSDGTKVTLSVLFDCFNEDKNGRAWPSHEYLALESGGVTERTIYNRVTQAENAYALIVENRGGGVVHHDNGSADGVTCHYYMGVPGSVFQGSEEGTLKIHAAYPENPCSLPGKSAQGTLKPVSDNTPIDTPKENPIENPNRRASSTYGVDDSNDEFISIEIEESPPLVPFLDTHIATLTDEEPALNPETPSPSAMVKTRAREPGNDVQGMRPVPLPIATEEQRAALCAAWNMDWPVDGKMFKRTSMSHADAKYLCVNDALDVLGYLSDTGATLKMTKHVDGVLDPYRSELARQRCLGELSWTTVANVLAVTGLKPPDAPQDQIPAHVSAEIDLREEGKWL
jgi:hypothetical protein